MRWITGRIPPLRYKNRTLAFTATGFRFILLTLAVGIAAINTGNNLLYLILAMMLSFIVLSGILSEQTLRNIHPERMLPAHLFAEKPVSVHLKILNRKRRFSSFSFTAREVDQAVLQTKPAYLYNLPAQKSHILRTTYRFRSRGRLTLRGVRFETTFPFGFFEKSLTRDDPYEVVVFPRIVTLPDRLASDLGSLGDAREVPSSGHGASVRNLRPYLPRDDARNIHWKASARGAMLLVKEFEEEEERQFILTLYNVLPKPATRETLDGFERAVSIAASLAYHWLMLNHGVEIQTVDGSIPMEKGQAHLLRILRFLGTLEPAGGPVPLQRLSEKPGNTAAAHVLVLPGEIRPAGLSYSRFSRIITPSDWKPTLEPETDPEAVPDESQAVL
jgi:uncharacterized protein (DUF58 family)